MTGRTDANFDYGAPPRDRQPFAGTEGAATRYVAPFNLAFNTQLGLFPWLELPENEDRLLRFGHAMVGTRQCETKNEILRGATLEIRMSASTHARCTDIDAVPLLVHTGFPWEDLPRGSVLVDVGGGIGAQSILVAQAHLHIHVVVEDREQVVSTAASVRPPHFSIYPAR